MRSVVASHGPGSNPRGPNQTLEEIRPAVTTSPERRPAGGRHQQNERRRKKSRAPQGRARGRYKSGASCATVARRRQQAAQICAVIGRPAAQGSATIALDSGRLSATITRVHRPASAQRRSTRCATRRATALVQARDAPAMMHDGRASFGRHSRDGARRGAAACGAVRRSMCDDILAVLI
ncbi:hypothetical protein F511_44393 [Dorcoceras hygrometricum]|uniref:Uncharacterized protein n=1 Tax=Dorcoceras hygrometricum TaxID=472368 RepID=A0A2Z7C0I8_9LAMI|nr:hypothetical protein F511_44393 [Dorcoceras hygrometricum]